MGPQLESLGLAVWMEGRDSSGMLAALQIISRVSNGGLLIQRNSSAGKSAIFLDVDGESDVNLQEGAFPLKMTEWFEN